MTETAYIYDAIRTPRGKGKKGRLFVSGVTNLADTYLIKGDGAAS
ncbi:hypothetical protein PKHYL_15120 [Psychrobacter sp. KH172YL61]|nr:hypothetical protein PKHYL_15120 [Psychrobacter sp. KH172YL61]